MIETGVQPTSRKRKFPGGVPLAVAPIGGAETAREVGSDLMFGRMAVIESPARGSAP